ncbi:hypothetical protein JTB14_029044 [Gonioctena quinquepunctata]|nr:hypothetical protein JTB14_029044 [Gonioctena quinquepunctata]
MGFYTAVRKTGGLGIPRLEWLLTSDPAILKKYNAKSRKRELARWSSQGSQGKSVAAFTDSQISNAWLSDSKLLKPCHMITALRMRTNSCTNRVAMNRAVPVPNLNCRQCGTQLETLGLIIGMCRYTKPSRIRRHNEICELIVAESTKQGPAVAVTVEPTLIAPCGGNLKPDLVIQSQGRVFVVDVTVRHEDGDGLATGRNSKIEKYSQLLPQLRQRYQTAEAKVLPIVVGTRGAMPRESTRCLAKLGLNSKSILKTISLIALRSSIEIYHDFMDYNAPLPPTRLATPIGAVTYGDKTLGHQLPCAKQLVCRAPRRRQEVGTNASFLATASTERSLVTRDLLEVLGKQSFSAETRLKKKSLVEVRFSRPGVLDRCGDHGAAAKSGPKDFDPNDPSRRPSQVEIQATTPTVGKSSCIDEQSIVNDEVLKEYSMIGEKGKKNFSSLINLCNVIKVAMGTYEAEQARLERLMDEIFDEEGLDDTDEEFINEELDVFETREEDSESEQDLSDREDLTEEDSNKPYYRGKPSKNKPNDAIRWFKHPSNQNVRTRSCNIIFYAPSTTAVSKEEHLQLRAKNVIVPEQIRERIKDILKIEDPEPDHAVGRENKRGSCTECSKLIGATEGFKVLATGANCDLISEGRHLTAVGDNNPFRHFATIGHILATKIKETPGTNFKEGKVEEGITLNRTDLSEVKEITKDMKNHSTPGIDGITKKYIEALIDIIGPKIVQLINLELENGCFPEELE